MRDAEAISKRARTIRRETETSAAKICGASQKNSERPSEGTPYNTIRRGLCQAESGGKDGFSSFIEMRSIFPLTIVTHFGILDGWAENESPCLTLLTVLENYHSEPALSALKTGR
jgi:hypothetical protein